MRINATSLSGWSEASLNGRELPEMEDVTKVCIVSGVCVVADGEEDEVSMIFMARREVVLSEMPKRRSVSAIWSK